MCFVVAESLSNGLTTAGAEKVFDDSIVDLLRVGEVVEARVVASLFENSGKCAGARHCRVGPVS